MLTFFEIGKKVITHGLDQQCTGGILPRSIFFVYLKTLNSIFSGIKLARILDKVNCLLEPFLSLSQPLDVKTHLNVFCFCTLKR